MALICVAYDSVYIIPIKLEKKKIEISIGIDLMCSIKTGDHKKYLIKYTIF